jgi:hypothetical protein
MTSNNHSRKSLFDRWSTHYDDDVDVGQFPLIGYGDVLQAVIKDAGKSQVCAAVISPNPG